MIQKPSVQLDDPTLAYAGAFGRETLPGSDLVKMGARVYDPGAGAFISRDPVTGGAAEPARRVAYAYAFNGPARYSDLDGRSVKDALCEIVDPCRLAPEALEWQERTINDPHASGLKKLYAKVGKVISSQFKCENLPGTVMFAIPGPFGKGKAFGKTWEIVSGTVKAGNATKKVARSVAEILGPLQRGRSANVFLAGSDTELRRIYTELAAGGTPVKVPGYPGTWVERADGVRVGIREYSKSGGATIDIRHSSGKIQKVHIR